MALYLGSTKVSLTSGIPAGGIDTSDATATASSILSGKTAYVNGSKITGTCTYDATTSDATATSNDIASGKTAYVKGSKVTGAIKETTSDSAFYDYQSGDDVKPVRATYMGQSYFMSKVPLGSDVLLRSGNGNTVGVALHTRVYGDAEPSDVVKGKVFTSSEGIALVGTAVSSSGIDTSDATATAATILSGKTAYVKGSKVTGTCTYDATTSDATATAATILSGKTAYVKGSKITGTCTYDATTSDATASASDIASGKTAYVKGAKVTGTYIPSAGLDTSDATATASSILSGKTAYVKGSKVTGTCTYNCNSSDGTAVASDIVKGKTAYVNGVKVTGTMDLSGYLQKTDLLNYIFPVGSIYSSVKNTSPQSFLGGTWVAWGSGRVPVGVNTNDTNFSTVEKTGGAATVANALIQHTHTITASGSTASAGAHTHTVTISATAANAGSATTNSTHNNLQPYITCYMWKRTS